MNNKYDIESGLGIYKPQKVVGRYHDHIMVDIPLENDEESKSDWKTKVSNIKNYLIGNKITSPLYNSVDSMPKNVKLRKSKCDNCIIS